jgi:hypothetical protein
MRGRAHFERISPMKAGERIASRGKNSTLGGKKRNFRATRGNAKGPGNVPWHAATAAII